MRMVLVVVLFGVVTFLVWDYVRSQEGYASLDAECTAAEAFWEWRQRNQGVHVGLSPEGSRLVIEWLEAYDWFHRMHPYIDGAAHRVWIENFLNDLPPKTPLQFPTSRRSSLTKAAALSYIKK